MHEFNPLNERFKKEYEDALLHGAHKEKSTVDAIWKDINLFEDFTGKKDFISFNTQQAKDFKRWLAKQRNRNDKLLSISTIRSRLANIREFFKWLAMHPKCIRKVDGNAVSYLRLSNNEERAARATKQKPSPTIEEFRKALETMPSATNIEKRNRAIMAFAALTGARNAAIISMKMKDIDLENFELWQDPRHVNTKNRKNIDTILMDFDPIWKEIVIEWINHARDILKFKDSYPIFPKEMTFCDPKKMKFESGVLSNEHWSNTQPVRTIFKNSFIAAGLPYFHPHSVRNMLVIWAMDNCNQYQVKAISQNIGHEHMMTTYNAYGKLNIHDQRKAIFSIGKGSKDLKDVPIDELLKEIAMRTK